jgi:hypothetical protein
VSGDQQKRSFSLLGETAETKKDLTVKTYNESVKIESLFK